MEQWAPPTVPQKEIYRLCYWIRLDTYANDKLKCVGVKILFDLFWIKSFSKQELFCLNVNHIKEYMTFHYIPVNSFAFPIIALNLFITHLCLALFEKCPNSYFTIIK